MNHKVLVEILLPASRQTFDVYLPLDIKLYEATQMVAAALTDLSNGNYKAREDAVLCDAESGIIYNINMVVAELDIKNGSKLMLI